MMFISIVAIMMFVHLKNRKLLIFSLAFFMSLASAILFNYHPLIFLWTPLIIFYYKDLVEEISIKNVLYSLVFSLLAFFTTTISISADAMSYAAWANTWRTNPRQLLEFNLLLDHIITLDVVLSAFRLSSILNSLQYLVLINAFFTFYIVLGIYEWSRDEYKKISASIMLGIILMLFLYNSSFAGFTSTGVLLFIIGVAKSDVKHNKITLLLVISAPRNCLIALIFSIIKNGYNSKTTLSILSLIGIFSAVHTENNLILFTITSALAIYLLLILKDSNILKFLDNEDKFNYDYVLICSYSIVLAYLMNFDLKSFNDMVNIFGLITGTILLFIFTKRNRRLLYIYNPLIIPFLLTFASWIPNVISFRVTDLVMLVITSVMMFQVKKVRTSKVFFATMACFSCNELYRFRFEAKFSNHYPDKYYEEAVNFLDRHHAGMVISDQSPESISDDVWTSFHRHHRAALLYSREYKMCEEIINEIMCINYWGNDIISELKYTYLNEIIFISKSNNYEDLLKVKGMEKEFENTNYLVLKINNG